MQFPGFFFGGASFGRGRHRVRPSLAARRRRDATHRLGGESLEGRAVLAVVMPAPIITSATDGTVALRTGSATNAASLTISGTVSSSATAVEVFNGNVSLGTATPSGKTWSFAATALNAGTYSFRARATNGAATSLASARAFVVTVDTTAPQAPTVSSVHDDRSPAVGAVPRNGVTNDRTLTLVGTAEPGSRVEVFAELDGNGTPAPLGVATLVGSTWRFTTRPLATDGRYSFTANATDKAGNTSSATVSPYVVTVDTVETTPTIAGIDDNVGTVTGNILDPSLTPERRGLTNDTVLEIRGTADAGSVVRIFAGKSQMGTVRAGNTGDWTFRTRPLTNGQAYRFAAQAADAAGNVSAMSAPVTPVQIDTTAPWAVITGVEDDGSKSIADRGVTNQTSLTVYGRLEPGSTLEVIERDPRSSPTIDTPHTPVIDSGEPSKWSLSLASLAERPHRFYVKATDAAGNTSVLPSVNYTVTVDRTAPSAPKIVSAIDSMPPNVGVLQSGDVTNDTRPLFTGTTTELGTTVRIYDGTPGPATFLGFAEVTGMTWAFKPKLPLAEGLHTLNATATDAAGNESEPGTFTVIVDTSAAFFGFGTQPAAGVYALGDAIFFDLEFTPDTVFVDTTGGTPRIPLNTVPQRYAIYDSGSGTDTLRFKYEPQLGDKTTGPLDFAPATIDPNGGTIRDAAGNDVNPTLGSLGGRDINVDAKLTIQPLTSPPNALPLPSTTGFGPLLTTLAPLTIKFNAPLTSGLTARSFDLFLEDRSMATEGVLIEDLGNNSYRLTLPPATHQSLKGRYRLDIGGVGSGIESNGVPMDTVFSLYWQLHEPV
jgi:hypothetical protein